MNTEALASAIIGHLVGDYLLQNDFLAMNKKAPGASGAFVCMIHAVIWTFSVCLFAGWPLQGVWIAPILFVTHFVQDRTNLIARWMILIGQQKFMLNDQFNIDSKPTGREDGQQNVTFELRPGLGPWSVILVDNIWHLVTIWVVWRFVA